MQSLVIGAANGLVLALLAMAFYLPYAGTGVLHLALGASFVLAPYAMEAAGQAGAGPLVAALAGIAASAVLSLACEVFNHRLLEKRGGGWAAHMLSSLGIYIAAVQAITLVWGSESRTLSWLSGAWRLGSVVIGRQLATNAGLAAVLMLVVIVWLRRSQLGLRLRALASNPTELALCGHDTRLLRTVSFALSGGLAGVASLLGAFDTGFDPTSGLSMVFLAFAAVIIGGRDRLAGPLAGGFLLGLARALAASAFASRWQDPITFSFLILFLFFRPQGLLAPTLRAEARS